MPVRPSRRSAARRAPDRPGVGATACPAHGIYHAGSAFDGQKHRMLKIDTHAHYLPRDWPDLARKYGDERFPVIHHTEDGRHRIYKDGKFFREIWSKTWD